LKRIIPYFFAVITLSLFSFNAKSAEKGIIRGKVVEEVGALPIPFAIVSVFEATAERPLISTQTDENGYFKFINLKVGTYKVKVSYIGFATLFVNEIVITDKDFDKNLSNLKLSNEQSNLNEVVISAQKPLVEFGADVITYNVGSSVLAEGSTATDVLKNVPMVQVDIDGNATISGKRSTRVFIDGKPSEYMTSNIADLLNVLPSDAIEKIEVMTNPPSKYSGDGEGILNIVMKKGYKVGFNGNIGINAGIQGNYNTNANASYRGKNYNLLGSGAYRQNIGRNSSESFRQNYLQNTTTYNDQYNTSRSDNNGGNFRLGFDWDITPKQSLRLSTNYNLNSSNSSSGNDIYYLNASKVATTLRNQRNTGDGNSDNFVFNADYNLQTDTSGGRLVIGITANKNGNNDLRTYNRSYTFPANLNPTLQQNDTEISSEGLTFNLDYDKPVVKKRDQLEFGLAYSYRKNDNDLLVENFNYKTALFEINQNLTNKFFYNENILAGYASYNYRKKGWGIKAGIRSEYTNVNFDLSTGAVYNVKPYLSLFPSVSLNRFFKKRYNFGLTYSVRVNRPRENFLNPQVNNADTLNIFYGNPSLSPSYTHQMDFSFGAFGQKWSFTPRISYSTSSGVIERYRFINANVATPTATPVTENTFANVGTNNRFALMLIGNFRPNSKIVANGNFTIVQSKYISSLNSTLNRDGISITAALGFSMQLPYKTAFESNLNYANIVNSQGRNKGSVTTSFGARKSFFKNTWSARISTSDPFGKRKNSSISEGPNFFLESYSRNNTNNVNLALTYRFTKVKVKKVVIPPPPKN
jgi:outer membrane receptor protein involved in Fe transport